ncbi:MAG: DsrE family protein [Cyclobacteriaceae bacterium]|nr:DsrE family protein [Cyclobacteriaceae bacterium]
MKLLILISACVILLATDVTAQERIFPVIPGYGGIFDIPDAVEKPDPSLEYKIVIDLAGGSADPAELNFGLNNIARMINLHASAGVPKEKIQVVVAIHNEAAYTILSNMAYRQKYKVDNPNLGLYKELQEAGVKLFVCGQSLIARSIERNTITPEVQIATSMLTVLSTHQLKGYAWFKF